MILSRGYNIGSAVYDTILENKFKYTFNLLTKREDKKTYQFTGEDGNNLAHLIAAKSKKIDIKLLEKIVWILNKKEINFHAKNKLGETPLHSAAQSGSQDMIQLMLNIGVDANATDNAGLKPLNSACVKLNYTVFKILVTNTTEAMKLDAEGRNLIHYICMSKYSNNAEMTELLTHFDEFNFNVSDNYGKLPLHYYAKFNSSDKAGLEKMLEKTTNADHEDKIGQTPVMIFAKCSKNVPQLGKLIEKIHNINQVDAHGRTLLSNIISGFTSSSYNDDQS
jgi:ankyrin repeat protein